jgi:hypothetical protein
MKSVHNEISTFIERSVWASIPDYHIMEKTWHLVDDNHQMLTILEVQKAIGTGKE